MLFNTYSFIFLFLPVALLGFYWVDSVSKDEGAIRWLVLASLFFYGWWNYWYLILIILSIVFNYWFGVAIATCGSTRKKIYLIVGVGGNLVALGYFKYANFFVDNFNYLLNTDRVIEPIILPLALSFFTFQQIAYLVDSYKGKAREYSFSHYALFVSFFPQLIAGPIVHHKEMIPQFLDKRVRRFQFDNLSIGVSIFCLGLFKKVVLADGLSSYSTSVFDFAEQGNALTVFEAWGGALSYTFQLYFDFSGYSDMAIGLARMFGIILPMNFASPYKAASIIEFWRCWHITLSRFLRDYLYIPLGGNRKGRLRRFVNLTITMLLGGLWHGASWTFVIWGGLHGLYLIANYVWRDILDRLGYKKEMSNYFTRSSAKTVTFIFVIIGWVFFRSTSLDGALNILESMFGVNGISLSGTFEVYIHSLGIQNLNWVNFGGMFHNGLANWTDGIKLILISFFIVFFMPNTQEFFSRYKPTYEYLQPMVRTSSSGLRWAPTRVWAIIFSLATIFVLSRMTRVSEFLYYTF